MSIQPLPPEVVAQIKSSATITNLNGVVFELAKNALDASSTKIDITVDYSRGGCIVEDNGLGIQPSEFAEKGGLGKLYHSSKLYSQSPTHGGRGTFLASLAALSLLSITSHHHMHHSHNSISLHKSEVVTRQSPAPIQQHLSLFDHGTRVTVRDLFGNMPVRVKQRAVSSEALLGKSNVWELLRRDIVALLLAWPGSVSVTVREVGTGQKISIRDSSGVQSAVLTRSRSVDSSSVCKILTQASYISAEDKSSWVHIRASTSRVAISGTISLVPSATKHVQFLALGIQPLLRSEGQNVLYEEINRMFLNSAFGNEEDGCELDDAERDRRAQDRRYKGDGYTKKELKGGRKGVERWPMFYINIQISESSPTQRGLDMDDVLDDKGNSLGSILYLLQAMLLEFLTKNHFRPNAPRGHRLKKSIGNPVEDIAIAHSSPQLRRSQSMPLSRSPHTPVLTPSASPSAKAGVQQRASHETKISKFDMLGTNIKFPVLKRQSSHPDSPFDAWSRVKSGATSTKFTKLTGAGSSHAIQTSSSSLVSTSHHATLRNTTSGRKLEQPLVSKSGKITRQPFEDVDLVQPLRKLSHQETNRRPSSEEGFETVQDDIVAWVNPVTKVRSLVDGRTGNMVPPSKQDGTRQPAVAIRGRLSTSSNLKPNNKEPSPWIKEILENWNNPTFRPAELAIPQVSFDSLDLEAQKILHGRHHCCPQLDIERAFTGSSTGFNGRISKNALRQAEVISQVDKKFIMVKLASGSTACNENSNSLLVIIDQHAADERIRIEALMEELCTPSTNNSQSSIQTMSLDKPLAFDIATKEIQLLRTYAPHFANWGILYDLPPPSATTDPRKSQRILVGSLPPSIIERCKLDPKLLIELIRTEAWIRDDKGLVCVTKHTTTAATSKQAWLQRIHDCPQGIMDILNSRACRSAIMFNDELSNEQCKTLTQRLAECDFPFQCAHGRPSMVPLADLSMLGGHSLSAYDGKISKSVAGSGGSFGAEFRRWKSDLQNTGYI